MSRFVVTGALLHLIAASLPLAQTAESISKRGLDSDGPTPINYGEPICILCFSDFQRGQRNDKPLTSLASPRFEMLSSLQVASVLV